jgi:hypothetical protein
VLWDVSGAPRGGRGWSVGGVFARTTGAALGGLRGGIGGSWVGRRFAVHGSDQNRILNRWRHDRRVGPRGRPERRFAAREAMGRIGRTLGAAAKADFHGDSEKNELHALD